MGWWQLIWPSGRSHPPCIWIFYIDILLTGDSHAVLEKAIALTDTPEHRWLGINKSKQQGPGLSVKFLGVILLGKMKVNPDALML